MPAMGVFPNGTVANVTIAGANFGPPSSPFSVTLRSGEFCECGERAQCVGSVQVVVLVSLAVVVVDVVSLCDVMRCGVILWRCGVVAL